MFEIMFISYPLPSELAAWVLRKEFQSCQSSARVISLLVAILLDSYENNICTAQSHSNIAFSRATSQVEFISMPRI